MLDQLFRLANLFALLGWLALALAPLLPRVKPLVWNVTGLVLPGLYGLLYVGLMAQGWGQGEGGFSSLPEVQALFAVPSLLLGGWLHYLAFDLFVGTWIARDAARRGLPHLALLPCFALTFFFGPAGLLLYLLLRVVFSGLADTPAQEG